MMKLPIKTRIIGGFLVVFLIGIASGICGLYSLVRISTLASEQRKIQDANISIMNVLNAHYIWRQNLTVSVFTGTEFTGSYDPNACDLGRWLQSEHTQINNDEINRLLDKIKAPHDYIHTEAANLNVMVRNGNLNQAQKVFLENIEPKVDEATGILTEMTEQYKILQAEKVSYMEYIERLFIFIIVGFIIAAVILAFAVAFVVLRSIMLPLKRLSLAADTITSGNFSVNFDYAINDEIGALTNNLSTLTNTFKSIINDIYKMSDEHKNGDIDYFMQCDKYKGEFKDVITGINSTVLGYVDATKTIFETMSAYAEGNFDAKLVQFPGKKALANEVLDSVSYNLKNVKETVMLMVESVMEGQLDKEVDASKFSGDWKTLIVGMNRLLKEVNVPIEEVRNALSLVSKGKLNAKVTGNYKGQFKEMANSINRTIEILSIYIEDISSVLNELASGNFNMEIRKEYIGDFVDIKTSLNIIIDRLNSVMNEIGHASGQVATGAKQISQTSSTLSNRVVEQANSVEKLNAAIGEIHMQINQNSSNTTKASEFSKIAKSNAESGNEKMIEMLKSMDEINDASQNISKIIKVIEDIAFQTNLLALNAAVEAARAGALGKGFAVVAEEVGNLASKSKTAASNTTALIEQTIDKVSNGTKIANITSEALSKISESIENVSSIVNDIEESSEKQSSSIESINEGIRTISEITHANSATSEESAASSEELSSQAELLKSMIQKFNLKK